MIAFPNRDYSDDDIKAMKEITHSEPMLSYIKKDCKGLLDVLEKDKKLNPHYKDGNYLYNMLRMILQKYPFFDTYMKATLDEARKRHYVFDAEKGDNKLV